MTLFALAACLPMALILLGCVRGWPGWHTALLSLFASVVLAREVFHASGGTLVQAAQAALFPTLTTLGIVVPALLFSALLQVSGGMETLVTRMRTDSPRIPVVLFLVLGVSPLLEATCGFGTGIVVCVPLYLALGYAPRQATLLGIVGESSGAYASMGNALTLQASVTSLSASQLGMETALLVLPLTCCCALVAVLVAGGAGSLRRWGLVALGAAGLLVGGEWLGSAQGVELAGLLSSLLVCVVLGGLLWGQRIASPHTREGIPGRVQAIIALPFLLLVGGQVLLRDTPFLRSLALRGTLTVGTQHLVVAWHPGIWLLLSCACVMLLLRDRMALGDACTRTQRRARPLVTMITAFFLLASVMQDTGMIAALAPLFPPLPGVYLVFAPVLGMLGGWTTGSTVASNALCALLQQSMAQRFHLSTLVIGATQNAAGSFGRLLAPSCLFLVASAARVRERSFVVFALWLTALGLTGIDAVLAIVVCQTLWIALVDLAGFVLLLVLGCVWVGDQFRLLEPLDHPPIMGRNAGESPMLSFAIIGAGSGVFRHHLAALEQLPGTIIALVDLDPAVAVLRAQDLGCPLYTDYRQMLSAQHPDVAVVLTPPFAHASIACACLEAGCHVLVEKPMALHIAEADAMIETARRCQRQLGVVFQHRYRPEVQAARRLLDEGALGQIQHIQVFAACPRPASYYQAVSWRGTWSGEGGGVLMNQAPHFLDLVCFLLGRPDRVFAWTRRQLHAIETEDTVQAQMEWERGILGSFCASTALAGERVEQGSEIATITITGTAGSLCIRPGALDYTHLDHDMRHFARQRLRPFPVGQRVEIALPAEQGNHLAVYRAFCQPLAAPAPGGLLDGSQARASLELANGLLYSGHTQQTIEFPLDQERYGYVLHGLQHPVSSQEENTGDGVTALV